MGRSTFYGYSAQLVAEWCEVPEDFAAAWKDGSLEPRPSQVRMFKLHRDGLVLDPVRWKGWRVDGDGLVDPDGNRTTQDQLRAYAHVVAWAREVMREVRARGFVDIAQLLRSDAYQSLTVSPSRPLRGRPSGS